LKAKKKKKTAGKRSSRSEMPSDSPLRKDDSSENSWAQLVEEGLLCRFYVAPNAKNTEALGLYGEPPRIKMKLAAPAVEGAANQELIDFLRKALLVPQSKIHLIRGMSSRSKDVLVSTFDWKIEALKKLFNIRD